MSYHGKLQTLKNGTADSEIQLWAYQQIETIEYLYKTHDKDKAQLVAAEQLYLDSFERGKQIGYAEGMMNRSISVQNNEQFMFREQGKEMNANEIDPKYVADLEKIIVKQQAEIEALKADKLLHDEAYLSQMKEIEALKDEAAGWEMSYENCHRTCSGYGMN